MNKNTGIIDQIREAATKTDGTQNQLADRAGIDRATLSRFIRGERGMSMENVDALAAVLRLRIVVGAPKAKAPRKAGRK